MITPQEMKQMVFEKAVFGGYDMAAVDEFIDSVAADFTAMHKENNDLKGKMKVLVETIEDYRRDQEAVKRQLTDAQASAARLLAETEAKCEQLRKQAQAEVSTAVAHIRAETSAEEDKLLRAKALTSNYIEQMKQVCNRHIQLMDELAAYDVSQSTAVRQVSVQPEPKPEPKPEPVSEPVSEPEAEDIKIAEPEKPVEAVSQQPEPDGFKSGDTLIMTFKSEDLPPLPGGEPEKPQSAPDEDSVFADILRAASGEKEEETAVPQKTSKFEFINLQFGKDYDVNKQ